MVRYRVRSPSERPQSGPGQQHGGEDQGQESGHTLENIEAARRTAGSYYRYRRRRCSPRRLYRLRRRRYRSSRRRRRRPCRRRRHRRGRPPHLAPSPYPDTPRPWHRGAVGGSGSTGTLSTLTVPKPHPCPHLCLDRSKPLEGDFLPPEDTGEAGSSGLGLTLHLLLNRGPGRSGHRGFWLREQRWNPVALGKAGCSRRLSMR